MRFRNALDYLVGEQRADGSFPPARLRTALSCWTRAAEGRFSRTGIADVWGAWTMDVLDELLPVQEFLVSDDYRGIGGISRCGIWR